MGNRFKDKSDKIRPRKDIVRTLDFEDIDEKTLSKLHKIQRKRKK